MQRAAFVVSLFAFAVEAREILADQFQKGTTFENAFSREEELDDGFIQINSWIKPGTSTDPIKQHIDFEIKLDKDNNQSMKQYVSFCADYETFLAKATNADEDAEDAEAADDEEKKKFRDCLKVQIGDVKKNQDASYLLTDMNNNNPANIEIKDTDKDGSNVVNADMNWTQDVDETVTLDTNECEKAGTSKAKKIQVKKGCTFRFAVVRDFDTEQTDWDYWFSRDDLKPAENEEFKLYMENVSVRVADAMFDHEVDDKDTTFMLGPVDKMQILGFEHASKKDLKDYVEGIIAGIKDDVSTTYATLDTIFLGYQQEMVGWENFMEDRWDLVEEDQDKLDAITKTLKDLEPKLNDAHDATEEKIKEFNEQAALDEALEDAQKWQALIDKMIEGANEFVNEQSDLIEELQGLMTQLIDLSAQLRLYKGWKPEPEPCVPKEDEDEKCEKLESGAMNMSAFSAATLAAIAALAF